MTFVGFPSFVGSLRVFWLKESFGLWGVSGAQDFCGGLIETLPDGVDPCEVLGLHEDGTKTGHGAGGVSGKAIGQEETQREVGECKVKIEMSGLIEDALGECRG